MVLYVRVGGLPYLHIDKYSVNRNFYDKRQVVRNVNVWARFGYDGYIGAVPEHIDGCCCVAGEFFAFHVERGC